MERSILPLLCAAALAAGEAAPAPLVEVGLADLARSRERLAQGPYGRIWSLPQLKAVRARLAQVGAEAKAAKGADPWELWDAATACRMAAVAQAGEEPVGGLLALRLPAGKEPPQAAPGHRAARLGEWWVDARGIDPVLPATVAGPPSADLLARMDLSGLARLADRLGTPDPGRPATPASLVTGILGLRTFSVESTLGSEGSRESALLAGAQLPLAPVDAALCAALPDKPLLAMAVGVDGPALVGTVRKLVEGLEHPLAWTRANLEARREIGASLEEFLGGFNGTVLLAVTPGTPFPAFTLAIPANQAVDLAVQGLLAKALRGAPAPTLDELRQAAVPLPMPGPAPVQPALRRSTSHWIIGSDALLVDGLATGAPGGFDAAKAWPEAKGACLLAYQDTGGLARTAAGFLPMAAMQVPPEQRPLLQAVTAALAAAAPLLEPSTVSGVAGPQGLRLEGRNALATLALPAVAAGLALPAINETRRQAQRTAAGNNMRHQVLLCQLWRNDHDDLWPADLQLAIKEYGDDQPGLAERLQRDPANPGIARPYLYVRPAMNATSLTPALVQDPACNQGEGSMVCYADGHVRFVRGTALWAEAQRLAPTPKAAQKGLERSDWTVPVE